jgi:tetratricopeptide (TPR) repeat protein
MSDSKRDLVIRALTEQRAVEDQLVASASEDERAATGTLERWSLRDNVAHIAHWRRHLAGVLAERREGGPGIDNTGPEEDAKNAEIHAEWRDRSWTEVMEASRTAGDVMVAEVGRWDDAAFEGEWSEEGTVFARITGNSIFHPSSHLATWLQENGRAAEARTIYEEAIHRGLSVDDSERAQGTGLYNIACFDALEGNRAEALAGLAVAFEKRPDLVGWATEDADLASLHDDPDFRALLPQH